MHRLTRSKLKQRESMQVDVYTTQICPYCLATKDLLTNKGISFTEHDVSFDSAMRITLIEKTAERTPTDFFNDQQIGVFTDLEYYFDAQA
ncbi:MAG: glutaredoxin 3 [Oleiphilaceae bacterium]|jgi:glutaredoxin 3